MLKLHLDIVDEDNDKLVAFIARSAALNVKVHVIDYSGPAGGNPLCEVEGKVCDVVRWVYELYLADERANYEDVIETLSWEADK